MHILADSWKSDEPKSLLTGSVSYMRSEKCEQCWADCCDSDVGQGNAGLDQIQSVTGETGHAYLLGRMPAKLWQGSHDRVQSCQVNFMW